MKTLIYRQPFFHQLPHLLPSNFLLSPSNRNHNFLRIHDHNCHYSLKTLSLCSATSSHSLSYGGWDDFQLDSDHSSESNPLHDFLNSLGIGDKKYVFVYLFGFVCALAVSRVKVPSIIVFPASAILFAVGFSVGLVKGGGLKEFKLNGNKRKIIDENFTSSIEKLRNLGDSLNGYNAKVLNLKNDIRRGIEHNQVNVGDLEGYIDVLESADITLLNATDVVESCIKSILGGNQEKEVGNDQDSSRQSKKFGETGLNFSRFFNGLSKEKFDGSKPGKRKDSNTRKMMDADLNNKKQLNMLDASVRERNFNSAWNAKVEDTSAGMFDNHFDNSFRSQNMVEDFVDRSEIGDTVVEDEKRNAAEENDTDKVGFDQTMHSFQKNRSKFVNIQQDSLEDYHDGFETMASRSGSYDSVGFSISMDHIKTAASFGHHQKYETENRSYSRFESREEEKIESERYSYRKEMFTSEKQPSFPSNESAYENVFDSSPSTLIDDDLNFNRYLTEANDLLKEAKRSLRHQVDDNFAEHALHKSAILLSKALDMRPMSLLAVGQLGNTYLLHGELKLKISREMRKLLVRNGSSAGGEGRKVLSRFDQQPTKDKIISGLVDVCEECEELLIKAGRKYKLALSIDGNDMRALYNWGLALSFRAQLIADIGPASARDADKVFLAAIDKFDAMMSKSNVYAPDALFRWGAALQQRSWLRPRNSREKVKLLQQAKCLYEDALHMDSRNRQLQEALSSCVSELDYWYR